MSELRASVKTKLSEAFEADKIKEAHNGFKINQPDVSLVQLRNLDEVSWLGNIDINIKRSGVGIAILIN